MKRKILISFIFILIVSVITLYSYAGILDDIISQGSGFSGSSSGIGKEISGFIENDVLDIVGLVGNLIFAIVTVVLGMKYIWASAAGRAQVLESLPAFVLAVIFFYLANTIVSFLNASDSIGGITTATTWNSVAGRIIKIVYTIVKYGSVMAIIVIGIKYMFASADGRANMKETMGGMVIGILFVFSASNIVEFIVESAKDII